MRRTWGMVRVGGISAFLDSGLVSAAAAAHTRLMSGTSGCQRTWGRRRGHLEHHSQGFALFIQACSIKSNSDQRRGTKGGPLLPVALPVGIGGSPPTPPPITAQQANVASMVVNLAPPDLRKQVDATLEKLLRNVKSEEVLQAISKKLAAVTSAATTAWPDVAQMVFVAAHCSRVPLHGVDSVLQAAKGSEVVKMLLANASEGLFSWNSDVAALIENIGVLPTSVDVGGMMDAQLNNQSSPWDTALFNRDDVISKIKDALLPSSASPKRVISKMRAALIPRNSTQKPTAVILFAMRGMGKTQVIKRAAFDGFQELAKCGRLITVCCSRSESRPWMRSALADEAEVAIVLLIKDHLMQYCGMSESDSGMDFKTPREAYAAWEELTAKRFKMDPSLCGKLLPLIFMDTCEILAGKPAVTKTHSSGKKYNLLERFCVAIPTNRAVLCVGCNAAIDWHDPVTQTELNVFMMPTLTPISFDNYEFAVRSWHAAIDDPVKELIYELSAGVPRMLRLAHESKVTVSLAEGAGSCLSLALTKYITEGQGLYNIPKNDRNLRLLYACMLCSGTCFPVHDVGANVPMPTASRGGGDTFQHAIALSMGALDARGPWFVVPPLIFGKRQVVTDMMSAVKNHKSLKNIPDLPTPEDLMLILRSDCLKMMGRGNATDRGPLFEAVFVRAFYARYLLVKWRLGADWVPLEEVLVNAFHADDAKVVKKFEINLSAGIKYATKYKRAKSCALSWCKSDRRAHHDAYAWCRFSRGGKLVECPMPIQMRHGNPKTAAELKKTCQLLVSKDLPRKQIESILLCVNQSLSSYASRKIVGVDASKMALCQWLFSISNTTE